MQHGIDVSNYSGTPTLDTLAALKHGLNLRKIVIACQFPATWAAWYPLADELGLDVEAYRFIYNSDSAQRQTEKALGVIAGCKVSRLWLDVELDEETPATPDSLNADLAESVTLWPGYTGIYTGGPYWQSIGNPQLGGGVPLWVANWTINKGYAAPPLVASHEVYFGGWMRARARQYVGEFSSFGLTMGLDVWDE